MKLIKDKNNKWSSKRVAGLSCFVIGLGMAIASGFDFANYDTSLVLAVLSAGAGVLGVSVFEKK